MGIARTFQTPRIVGEASVLENVMIGGTIRGQGTFWNRSCAYRGIAAMKRCCVRTR